MRIRGRQMRIEGALALPNRLRFERMEYTDVLLHSAAHAIWDIVSSLLLNMSLINSILNYASLGAIFPIQKEPQKTWILAERWEDGRAPWVADTWIQTSWLFTVKELFQYSPTSRSNRMEASESWRVSEIKLVSADCNSPFPLSIWDKIIEIDRWS